VSREVFDPRNLRLCVRTLLKMKNITTKRFEEVLEFQKQITANNSKMLPFITKPGRVYLISYSMFSFLLFLSHERIEYQISFKTAWGKKTFLLETQGKKTGI
jgi:hypothetical protein